MKNLAFLYLSLIPLPFFCHGQVQSAFPPSTAKNGALEAVVYDWEVIGVNPANLGWDVNHKFSFTILDAGISGESQAMNYPALMTALEGNSLADRVNAWQGIIGTPKGMNVNADLNWVAASWRFNTIPGAFAANIRDRVISNGYYGFHVPDAILNSSNREFNDATIMSLLDGTSLKYLHYREINLDYGVRLFGTPAGSNEISKAAQCFAFDKKSADQGDNNGAIYAGIGVKYIIGLANVNANVADGGLNSLYDVSAYYPNIFNQFFCGPGEGLGVDLGLSGDYKRWIFGISVTDIGFIRWHSAKNVSRDTNISFIYNGNDFINDLKTGTFPGSVPAPNFTSNLPTDLRLGASYRINHHWLISSDLVFPLDVIPGGLDGPYFAIGPQWNVAKFLTLSTGFATATNFGWGIPLGITLHATPNVDFYLGTGDITAYLGKTYKTTVSAAIWMFRWNF